MQCLHLWNTPPPYLGQTPLLNMQIFYSCIVSANRQLNFSLSLTKVGWHEFEKKISSSESSPPLLGEMMVRLLLNGVSPNLSSSSNRRQKLLIREKTDCSVGLSAESRGEETAKTSSGKVAPTSGQSSKSSVRSKQPFSPFWHPTLLPFFGKIP